MDTRPNLRPDLARSSGFRPDLSDPRRCVWVFSKIWVREWTLGRISWWIWQGRQGLGQISQTHAGVHGFSGGSGFKNGCSTGSEARSLDGSGQIWRGRWGLGRFSQTHAGVRGFQRPREPAESLFSSESAGSLFPLPVNSDVKFIKEAY
jgi:hypothetical protein